MRRNLIRAALMAGLFLSAGAAPVFANALDSQLQPIAAPIRRETVPFDGRESPGTIIIRTGERRLYLVMPDHQALKYGVGVGRPGFTWAGATHIGYKREWPDWTSPSYGRRTGQSARRARHVSRGHALSNSRLQ
jgi:lipoprotein-anchoring transpeptidase ErfK/SrfK